jgi:hypothetical protein
MANTDILWRPEDDHAVKPTLDEGEVHRPDILAVIDTTIDNLSSDLRELNLDIHGEVMSPFQGRNVRLS